MPKTTVDSQESPVTMKKLLPRKKLNYSSAKRKVMGINEVNSKVLTATPCRKIIQANHIKKQDKCLKKKKLDEEFKKLKQKIEKGERRGRNALRGGQGGGLRGRGSRGGKMGIVGRRNLRRGRSIDNPKL